MGEGEPTHSVRLHPCPPHLHPNADVPPTGSVASATYLRHVDAPDVVADLRNSQLLHPVRRLVLQSGSRDGPDGCGPKRHPEFRHHPTPLGPCEGLTVCVVFLGFSECSWMWEPGDTGTSSKGQNRPLPDVPPGE